MSLLQCAYGYVCMYMDIDLGGSHFKLNTKHVCLAKVSPKLSTGCINIFKTLLWGSWCRCMLKWAPQISSMSQKALFFWDFFVVHSPFLSLPRLTCACTWTLQFNCEWHKWTSAWFLNEHTSYQSKRSKPMHVILELNIDLKCSH